MDQSNIELTFLPAPGDPAPENAEYQAALWRADRGFQERGVKASSSQLRQDDAEMPALHLGQVVLTLGPPAVAALITVVGVWMQARFGRKVRLKVGDVEAEARTPEEVERLLKLASEMRDAKKAGDGP